jgi:SAM-dependent methyltransferase
LRFIAFQAQIGVTNVRDFIANGMDRPDVQVPPARLRFRVHGNLDRSSFLQTAEALANDVRGLAAASGSPLQSCGQVLDFGCGCGRVLRALARIEPNPRYFGTDIDSTAIAWCQSGMRQVEWSANPPEPPLGYDDDQFDFVFSISVFTHLDASMQARWLRELYRVTAPGGLVLLTVHGEHVYRTLPERDRQELSASGMLYQRFTTESFRLDGLPDFYQTAYHTRDYVEREWGKVFNVLAYIPRGINAHQDAVVLRKPNTR